MIDTDRRPVVSFGVVNGVDFGLAMEITALGCDVCGKSYIVGDVVDIRQNTRARNGRSWHRRCGNNG